VANGVQPGGVRHPTWNPVLFEMRKGELTLFYKVGPSPREWWGMVRTSKNGGRTWSDGLRLRDGLLGPIKNKPIRLADGTVISPSSTESRDTPSTWRVHFELSRDDGASWQVVRPAPGGAGPAIEAIQPSILTHGDGRFQAIGRTRSGKVFETWSSDRGLTWMPVTLTVLPNPRGRTPLNVALTRDGRTWEAAHVLETEPGEYSYPAVIQTSDNLVHITYTWKRLRIKHVVIDPAALSSRPMAEGAWPGP
jgi:predicted neuraminidase